MGCQLWFIVHLIDKWTGSIFLALVPWIAATLAGSLYFGLFGWMATRLFQSRKIWAIPFAWMAVEVFRSYIPVFAYPWGLVATPLSAYPDTIGAAHYIAIFGIGFWILSLDLAILMLVRSLKFAATILAYTISIPLISYFQLFYHPVSIPTKVSFGQLGVDSGYGNPLLTRPELLQAATESEALAAAHGSKLLVLPEATTMIAHPSDPHPGFPVSRFLPIVFGAQRGTGPVYQSAFAYDGNWKFMDKTRLVIFGEFVPGRSWIPYPAGFHLPTGDITAGDKVEALQVGKIKVGPIICFENLFPEVAWEQAMNHAQLLAEMSEEDWFLHTASLKQLRDVSVWRVIESGLPMVRASTMGYSEIIDRQGHVIVRAPLKKFACITAEVPIPVDETRPFWLPVFPVFGTILGFFTSFFVKRTHN